MPPEKPLAQLLSELKANKLRWTFAELSEILEGAGFTMHLRNAGSHRAFNKPGCFRSPSIPQGRGPVKPVYVRQVIQALEECCDDDQGG